MNKLVCPDCGGSGQIKLLTSVRKCTTCKNYDVVEINGLLGLNDDLKQALKDAGWIEPVGRMSDEEAFVMIAGE